MNFLNTYPKLNLKNRIVMAPMTRYSCDEEGRPSSSLIDYYVKRAKNKVGLIILESCAVNAKDAKGYQNGAQFHSETHLDAWKPAIESMQAHGSKVFIQLFHAGRLSVKEITGSRVISPSSNKTYDGQSFWRPEKDGKVIHFQTQTPFETPEEMSLLDIKTVITQFAQACGLAQETGFDGVELHGAHGYLLHQFCHAETNTRTDSFKAKDFLFIKELVAECRKMVSEDFILSYRLSVHMVDSSYIRYDDEKYNIGELVKILDEYGIDVFHTSELKAGARMLGSKISLSELVRMHTDKPLISCGKINSAVKASKVLDKGKADLIAIGRSFISNPDLVGKFAGEVDTEIVKFDYEQHIDKLE